MLSSFASFCRQFWKDSPDHRVSRFFSQLSFYTFQGAGKTTCPRADGDGPFSRRLTWEWSGEGGNQWISVILTTSDCENILTCSVMSREAHGAAGNSWQKWTFQAPPSIRGVGFYKAVSTRKAEVCPSIYPALHFHIYNLKITLSRINDHRHSSRRRISTLNMFCLVLCRLATIIPFR